MSVAMTWLGVVLAWFALVVGALGLVLAALIGARLAADAILKEWKLQRELFAFMWWRYRKAPHPDLQEHIDARRTAERHLDSVVWQMEELEGDVLKAVDTLRDTKPGNIVIPFLEGAVLGLRARRGEWTKKPKSEPEAAK